MFYKDYFERPSDRDREKERPLLVHYINGHNNQNWTRQKSGVRNSIFVSHVGSRDLSIWAIFPALTGTLAGS